MTRPQPHGDALLERLPDGAAIVGAEIGVAAGHLSAHLLARRPTLTLWMVDPWLPRLPGHAYHDWCARYGDPSGTREPDRVEVDQAAARGVARAFGSRARIVRATSLEAAAIVPDGLDFAFIDGDHREHACRADIDAWWPKIRPGGLLCGHDLDRPCFDGGVRRAVDAFLAGEDDLTLDTGDNWTWFIRKPLAAGQEVARGA